MTETSKFGRVHRLHEFFIKKIWEINMMVCGGKNLEFFFVQCAFSKVFESSSSYGVPKHYAFDRPYHEHSFGRYANAELATLRLDLQNLKTFQDYKQL